MAKKFSELVFYPNAKKKGEPEESGGTLDMKNGMPSNVTEEKKSDGMEIKHKSGRTETAKVHITGSDYHIVKTKHGAQYTVDKKGNVLHGHGNTNEGYNDNRTGFAKKKREDDEYHTPDPTTQTHKVGFHVSKDGGEKHHRTVTISNSTKSKEQATATAKAHLEKQGYKIHEEAEIEEGKKPDNLSPGWMLKADPKLKAAVDAKKAKYKEFKKLVGTKTNEEVELDESMTDSWKNVQSMDKGSLTGGKEEVRKHLSYLKAVHTHHKKYGNDTKKVQDKIESINRSRIAEEVDESMNLATAKMGDVIKDFQKSDAPQFAGKSAEKKRQMAIAAKLQADGETKKEETMLKFLSFVEALRGNQHKIDKNKNGKVDAHDFKLLRKEETEIEEATKDDAVSHAPVAPTIPRKYIKGTPEHTAYKASKQKSNLGMPTGKYNEETEIEEEVEELEERNKENATRRKMMDASRGARFKNQQGTTVPDPEPEHKTAQAHNKAIGRAIRKMSEDTEIDENAFDWKSKKSEPSSGRYEIKRVNGKTIVTRKYNPETGHSTGTDDGEPEAQKRGRGRPAGSKNR